MTGTRIDTELEFWRAKATNANPEAFISPSSRGTAINTNNFYSWDQLLKKKPSGSETSAN
jgi:hypothetical protein